MYVGHFAIGLVLKACFPSVPAAPIIFGVGFVDLLDGLGVVFGWNRVTPNLARGPFLFFDLTFIDWDHSVLAIAFWSLVWAAVWYAYRAHRRSGALVAAVALVASLSHFFADWPFHNEDLALYPYSETRLGYSLWSKLGIYSWLLEGLFTALMAGHAHRTAARRGENWTLVCAVLLGGWLNLSPPLSPMQHVALMDEPLRSVLHGVLVFVGFLLPGLLIVYLMAREEWRASTAGKASSTTPNCGALLRMACTGVDSKRHA